MLFLGSRWNYKGFWGFMLLIFWTGCNFYYFYKSISVKTFWLSELVSVPGFTSVTKCITTSLNSCSLNIPSNKDQRHLNKRASGKVWQYFRKTPSGASPGWTEEDTQWSRSHPPPDGKTLGGNQKLKGVVHDWDSHRPSTVWHVYCFYLGQLCHHPMYLVDE